MTVKELIEQLQQYPDQDTLVLVNIGDDGEDFLTSPDDHEEIEVEQDDREKCRFWFHYPSATAKAESRKALLLR